MEHLGTSFYEAIAINKPVIVYLNFNTYAFNKESLPLIKILIKVKIIHLNVISAIKHYNEIYENPEIWWQSDEVQKAREKFVNKYARTNKSWAEEWIKEFNSILNKN
jgi:putative transferase (TIGR04331 family)